MRIHKYGSPDLGMRDVWVVSIDEHGDRRMVGMGSVLSKQEHARLYEIKCTNPEWTDVYDHHLGWVLTHEDRDKRPPSAAKRATLAVQRMIASY